jgi:hypothetical protein
MPISDDRAYYARRIEASLRLAREAQDPGIRKIHLTMAAEYRLRAAEAAEKLAAKRPTNRQMAMPSAMSDEAPRPISRPESPRSL